MLSVEKSQEEGVTPILRIEVTGESAELLLNVLEDWINFAKFGMINNFCCKKGFISSILDPMGRGHLV